MARPRKENADYFSHDTNMRSHRKVIALRSKFGITGYAIYCMLLEHIASCDFFKAKYNDIEVEILAGDFGIDAKLLSDIISFCGRLGLIQMVDGYIECESMIERLQDLIKKRDRERSRDKPIDEKGKFVSVTETTQKSAEMPQSKVKESKVNNNKINNNIFKKPTVEEIKEYCKERKNQIDAQRFINYYDSIGWMVGKNKMKDWKATIRGWESRDKKDNIKPQYENKNSRENFTFM